VRRDFLAIVAHSSGCQHINQATFAALLADSIAAFPIIIHVWKRPDQESLALYLAGVVSSLMAVVGQESAEFLCLVYPVYFVALNLLIVAAIVLAGGGVKEARHNPTCCDSGS
jgi:hypothetical protein